MTGAAESPIKSKAQKPTMDPATVASLADDAAFEHGRFRAGSEYLAVKYVAHGGTGVVWQVRDRYNQLRAAKFTPVEFLDGASPAEELMMRVRLPAPLFTRAVDADLWTHPRTGRQFAVIVEEWVDDALTLEDFLDQRSADIESRTIVEFVAQFGSALEALEAESLAHDDLHARNILIRESRAGEPGFAPGVPNHQIVIVDTGSLKPIDTVVKSWTDYHHVAYHVAKMHNAVHARRALTLPDRRFLAEVRALMPHLTDDDADRAFRTGAELREQFEQAYTRAMFGGERDELTMNDPFEFISAEQISSDNLLLELFAQTTWLEKATSSDPLLLTGPRGCGKSMVLRWMSLRAHAERVQTEIPLAELNVAGIYVSCTADFQNRFAEFRTEEQVEQHRSEIVHYFNLVHLREVIATLLAVEARDDRERVFGLGQQQGQAVADFIHKFVPQSATVAFANRPLRAALSAVEAAIFEAQVRLHRGGEEPSAWTPLTFLGDLSNFLVREMPFFRSHRIAFLLDDFSLHRLSEHVQRALLPIIWERRSSHLFKVSSEKHGTVDDFQGGELTIDLARDRNEVDCGSEFLNADKIRNENFARQLLANRLKAAKWVGNPDELLGSSPTLGEIAARLASPGSGRGAYYGLGTIANLCSGDVSTLLLVFRHVLNGCVSTTRETVSARAQHDAIVTVSKRMLRAVIHHRPLGKELHAHGAAFGDFVQRMLNNATVTENGKQVPAQIPRIEVDNDGAVQSLLSAKQRRLRQELLRRAVFIEMDGGRSRREMVTTLRWHFRRIYLPSFHAGLGKNEALKTSAEGFMEFLEDPVGFLSAAGDNRLKARPATAAAPRQPELALWGEDHENS